MASNQGSSMPNQGDRGQKGNPNTGKSTKYGASVHKGKSKMNPNVPLALG